MSHDQFKDFQNATKVNNKSFGIQLSIIFFIIFQEVSTNDQIRMMSYLKKKLIMP